MPYNNEKRLFGLALTVIECLREIEAGPSKTGFVSDECDRTELNEELADAVEAMAEIEAQPYGREWKAKLLALRQYFLTTRCDADGELMDDEPCDRLLHSVLQDIFPAKVGAKT